MKTDNLVYQNTIKNLTGFSKEAFEALNYLMDDEELALGYLGLFEIAHDKYLHEKSVEITGGPKYIPTQLPWHGEPPPQVLKKAISTKPSDAAIAWAKAVIEGHQPTDI